MKVEQRQWTMKSQWVPKFAELASSAKLVMIFGETNLLKNDQIYQQIRRSYPQAQLLGCSTAGEIHGREVSNDSVSTTAMSFDTTEVKLVRLQIKDADKSYLTGQKLASSIQHIGLKHVIVLSVGLNVNGSELVKGLISQLPAGVGLSGGLAGDQDRFAETLVIANEPPQNNCVALVGLYGPDISVSSASLAGWDPFGPERLVTKSEKNILYELDGKSALELYKTYLGNHAVNLPASALLFPLSMKIQSTDRELIRTILSVNELNQSMTFAGDVPTGSRVRFMKANLDRLIDGASGAAVKCQDQSNASQPQLAILISCVGRKLVLKQRVEEEVEAVNEVFGAATAQAGFYSYGEISPHSKLDHAELHNQTMTVTTISEKNAKAA